MGEPPESVGRVRTYLANERTFLAWVRTGLAFVALGLASVHLIGEGEFAGLSLNRLLAFVLVVAGAVTTLTGRRRYRKALETIEDDRYDTDTHGTDVAVVSVLAVAVVGLLFILAASD